MFCVEKHDKNSNIVDLYEKRKNMSIDKKLIKFHVD